MADDKRIEPGPATQWIMRNLRRYREQSGLSYAELSGLLDTIGRPIPSQGLRRIERGDRRVDIDDVMAIAAVLKVPPVRLIFPLDLATAEILPGQEQSTWAGLKWFTGESADDDDPISLYREHDRLVERLQAWSSRLPRLREAAQRSQPPDAQAAAIERLEHASDDLEQTERAVVRQRERIRQIGLAPPPLPPDLSHLDNGGDRGAPA